MTFRHPQTAHAVSWWCDVLKQPIIPAQRDAFAIRLGFEIDDGIDRRSKSWSEYGAGHDPLILWTEHFPHSMLKRAAQQAGLSTRGEWWPESVMMLIDAGTVSVQQGPTLTRLWRKDKADAVS